MEKTALALSILFYAFIAFHVLADPLPTRKALLVGIGDYPKGSGWNKIASANDIKRLQGALAPTFRTKCLVDKQATYAGITRALDNLCREVRAGDTVLVHFSCHGQQMFTDKPDEPDRLDEALIPYDAIARESDAYHGEKHLRDDVLGEKMEAVRKSLGDYGLLIVSLDACHSGNSIKGGDNPPDSLCRGINDIFGVTYPSDVADSLECLRYTRDTTELSGGTPTVFISACGSTEKNYEFRLDDGTRVGSLSLSLDEAFKETGLTNLTSLLDGIHAKMERYGHRQTPQFKSSFGYVTPDQRDDGTKKKNGITVVPPNEMAVIIGKILKLTAAVVVLLLTLIAYGRRKIP